MPTLTCPWCDVSYTDFQPKCPNCGGGLPPPPQDEVETGLNFSFSSVVEPLSPPPPAPRSVPNNYIWRQLMTDAGGIVALVFLILGTVFTLVGGVATLTIVGAFVGIPFLILGIIFLAVAIPLMLNRHKKVSQMRHVLETGELISGQLVSLERNHSVRVNGRYPWALTYRFQVAGQEYTNKTHTLDRPGEQFQPGQSVYIFYRLEDPGQNLLYLGPQQLN